jgi:prolipoprotein diacylglyceryltransferase
MHPTLFKIGNYPVHAWGVMLMFAFLLATWRGAKSAHRYKVDPQVIWDCALYGLIGGVSFYMSSALYLGARIQYGLADITNNNADIAKARTGDAKSLILQNDSDQNFVIQASVGFSF